MPRQMPAFANALHQRIVEAIALAKAGDMVLATSPLGSALRAEWPVSRIELLYEIAYLRIFVEWERFLENTFVRYLCGYRSSLGQCIPINGQFFSTLTLAEAAVLGGRSFVLWHDPTRIVQRSQTYFQQGFHEIVIASNSARLTDLAAIRHRIVHDQEDARQKFDSASMSFAGRRYLASRPGRLLRDWDNTPTPQRRWLESFGHELSSLAAQIA